MFKLKRIFSMVVIVIAILSIVPFIAYAEDIPDENSSDLVISVVCSSQFPVAGQPLTYVVSIKNQGPGSATDVSLTTVLPSIFLDPEFVISGNPSPWVSPLLEKSIYYAETSAPIATLIVVYAKKKFTGRWAITARSSLRRVVCGPVGKPSLSYI